MRKKTIINYGSQLISKKDISAVADSLKKILITTGPLVSKFESNLKKYLHSNYVSVCNSGTAALHLAFLSIGLKKNDVVLMPSVTFLSCYNMAKICGAKIFLVDVDFETGQITPEEVLKCIKKNKIKKVKCIVTMHLGGYPREVHNFYLLKKKLKCFIIEDACHALGASWKYKNNFHMVGGCKYSDIACFSFHPLKTITTGEGGALSTNNKKIYEKSKSLRNHGLSVSSHWDYKSSSPGFNYKISDINCALGISQLKKIRYFIQKRKKIYLKYKLFFKKINKNINKKINFLIPEKNTKPSYNLFVIKLPKEIRIKSMMDFFFKRGIRLQIHYKPIYHFDSYLKYNNKIKLPNTEKYYSSSVSIPIHAKLSNSDLAYIMRIFNIFFSTNFKL